MIMAKFHMKVLLVALLHVFVTSTIGLEADLGSRITSTNLRSESVQGSWNVTDLNTTCILVEAKLTLNVNYTDVYNVSRVTQLQIPDTSRASGTCGNKSNQYIQLTWLQPNQTSPHGLNNSITFEFHANNTNKNESAVGKEIPLGKYALFKVTVVAHKDPTLFPNATNPTVPFVLDADNLVLFPTTLGHSYACQSELSILGATNEQQRAGFKLVLESSQFEAFRKGKGAQGNGVFSASEHCTADEISSGSVVGTIVGVLLAIVLIALVAAALATYYLKKKKTQTGYENM